jgi:hypothetical protein
MTRPRVLWDGQKKWDALDMKFIALLVDLVFVLTLDDWDLNQYG